MTSLSITRAVGGSLIVTIPSEIVKAERIREGEIVELSIKKHKKDMFGVLKGIGSFEKKDRMGDRN
ncbi:MAG: AbrB/MazE/SpoVT family DNA-binding domain-containing protein [archaeon]|nr:AbrB/MazE/SpoVT family DNA-binding domain-containing protein [archaeon]